MKINKSVYKTPNIIGLLGLFPFVFSGIAIWFTLDPWKSFIFLALINYCMIILGFLGAVHFGIAIFYKDTKVNWYIWSVIPSIFAWLSVLCGIGYNFLILCFIIAFLIILIIDNLSYKSQRIPLWYLKLRKKLTFFVIVSLFSVYTHLIVKHY